MNSSRLRGFAWATAVFFAPLPAAADAGARQVVVWPTLTPAGDEASETALHPPSRSEGPLFTRAEELDATLRDAVQDLGFTLGVATPPPPLGKTRDVDLIASAAATDPSDPESGTWVVSARLEWLSGDLFMLRMIAVAPGSKELRVRAERTRGGDIAFRGLVMLRDLLAGSAVAQARAESLRHSEEPASGFGVVAPVHSQGRAVLAVNAAAFGAFIAYGIQRASGSDDPRLLYPLLALGAGAGIGSALLASAEWDVSTGNAWVLAAGAWWGTASGLLLANGTNVQPFVDRYAWGVGGGMLGLGMGVFALTRASMDEGDAVLAHSGGALGTLLGGLGELAIRGSTTGTPGIGAGIGAAVGVVGAGGLAMFSQVSASRVLLIDLGIGVGGLAGAAAASPLVFDEVTEDRARAFVLTTMSASLAGGVTTWLLTRSQSPQSRQTSRACGWGRPVAGVIGSSASRDGPVPVFGAGWTGTF